MFCISLTGAFPACFKLATVTPILKKLSLDSAVYANYRPISNLSFLSKILEKTVFIQLQHYLHINSISDIFQSGFKPLHSTESDLLKVFNDILTTKDAGDTMALVLLDLSSAFDFVDHKILLSRLEHSIGISGTVLKWFQSYLSNRSFSVRLGTHLSSATQLWGTPGINSGTPTIFIVHASFGINYE